MATLFVRPLSFSTATTSPAPLAGSVANLGNDVPGMVWRYGLSTPYLIVDLGTAAAYDSVSIVGSNLRSTDTVQVRTGTTSTGTGGYAGVATVAYTSVKADTATAITVVRLGSIRAERYLRIDLVATGHPDGFVQFQRLVVGRMISVLGVEAGAELGLDDRSVVTAGPGYRSVDEYDVIPSWKISTGWISDLAWRTDWFPLLQWAGSRRAILFIKDSDTMFQGDMLFGCITSRAAGKNDFYDAWRFEATLSSLAQ